MSAGSEAANLNANANLQEALEEGAGAAEVSEKPEAVRMGCHSKKDRIGAERLRGDH